MRGFGRIARAGREPRSLMGSRSHAPRGLLRLAPALAVASLVLALFPASAMAALTDYFGVTGPSSVTAGVPNDYTVTAYTWGTSTQDTAYEGTVAITSSDSAAVLPSDAALTDGQGTFSVTLETVGSGTQTITATDDSDGTITGTSDPIPVEPATADHLIVAAPGAATVDSAFRSPSQPKIHTATLTPTSAERSTSRALTDRPSSRATISLSLGMPAFTPSPTSSNS